MFEGVLGDAPSECDASTTYGYLSSPAIVHALSRGHPGMVVVSVSSPSLVLPLPSFVLPLPSLVLPLPSLVLTLPSLVLPLPSLVLSLPSLVLSLPSKSHET